MIPQLQLEDIASLLKLAKTAKIDAGDAAEVGDLLTRVEIAVTIARLPRMPQGITEVDGVRVPDSEAPPAPSGAVPGAVAAAVAHATRRGGGGTPPP